MDMQHQHTTPGAHPKDISRMFEETGLAHADMPSYETPHATQVDFRAVTEHFRPEASRVDQPLPAPPRGNAYRIASITRSTLVTALSVTLLLLLTGTPESTPAHLQQAKESPFEARQKLARASNAAITAPANADTLLGTNRDNPNYVAQVSILRAGDVASARIAVRSETEEFSDEIRFHRAEADPALLSEVGHGKWSGTVPLYIFLSRRGENLRVIGQARLSISDSKNPFALLEVLYPAPLQPHAHNLSEARIAGEAAVPFQLSFTERIELSSHAVAHRQVNY